MKKYVRIYRYLISINFAKLIIYRANFISSLLSSLVWGLFILVQMLLLTSRIEYVFGWSKAELLLLTGVFSIGVGIFHIFLTENFGEFATIINYGQLDAWLLKPVDSQFLISLTRINFGGVTRLLAAFVFTMYVLITYHFQLSLLTFITFVLSFAAGLVLIYSVWLSVVTLLIWAPRLSNVVEFMFSYMGMGRFPREMFERFARVAFYAFLPITFFAIAPAKVLLTKASFVDIGGLFLLTFIFFFGSRKLWQFALKSYTSASS